MSDEAKDICLSTASLFTSALCAAAALRAGLHDDIALGLVLSLFAVLSALHAILIARFYLRR